MMAQGRNLYRVGVCKDWGGKYEERNLNVVDSRWSPLRRGAHKSYVIGAKEAYDD